MQISQETQTIIFGPLFPIVSAIQVLFISFSVTAFCDVSHFEFNKQLISNIGIIHRRKKSFNRGNRPHSK